MRFPEKWLDYARCMENKLTLRQCVAECDISLDTAFHWRHKFLDTESKVVENKVSGIVEVDEFFMAYSEKGSRCLSLNRAPKKRGGSDRRLQENQVPVLLSIDRNRHIVDAVLKRDTALEIQKAFIPHLEKYSVLCSDGSNTYVAIAHKKECDHKQLNSNKNRVLEKVYHIQNVNGAIAHFRGWVEDKMRGVATKYLSHYLAWFRMGYCKCGHVDMIKRAYASPQPT